MAKILNSRYFAHSERLSRFLRFTVEHTLEDRTDFLKEYLIATEVFERKDSFDPRTDAIVRVQAVNLRARVKAYYDAEGANDPVVISYTKGSYLPAFHEAGAPAEAPAGPVTIAVLPFVNMSPDPENEYFSDGLTEELISAVGNLPGMRVVARTSVFRFKGKPEDIRKIGAELNAQMVLEGSVRKAGNRLRITAQLIDAASGYETWSRTYRVQVNDLFAVQEEIAQAIASTLNKREQASLLSGTQNLDAYHSYLKGRFYLNKWTEEGFRKSVEFFEAAITQDPGMAAAYAGLSDAQFVLACYGKEAPGELMPKARRAAEKAMELNASLAEAHVSLGAVRAIYDWDWEGAEEEFRFALDLDADCAAGYEWYAVLCLIPQGRLAEAASAIRRALDLDPLSAPIHTAMGLVHFIQDQFDEAIACFRTALELDSNFLLAHWWLGAIYLRRSLLLKAFASFRKAGAVSSNGRYHLTKFTYGEGLVGRHGRSRKMLEALTRLSLDEYFSPVMVAAIHVVLGEKDAALDWLEKAYQIRDCWLVWLGVDRRFDPLRSDPRFSALLHRIGVASRTLAAAE